KLSFDSQKVSYHLEDESSIEIVSHNADHQQMVELIRVLNVTGEVKAMDELVKFAKNKPQALKMLANSSEKTRLVLLSHMATLNKITDDDTARTFLAICCVMAGGEMKATDASNAVLEELMNFVSNYQAPQATNSDPKAFLSALRKFVDSKDITIVYNDENIAQIVQSKWNLQKNNGTNEINLSALVEFATNNLESLDTLAQMVQFVMKLQENNETDKINEINTHALADFATNYPKSFDKLAQYDKPIPPGFLTAFLESEVWDKIFEELGKWKNLDELEGEKFLAEYAKLEKESDRELASILANTLHSIEVTRDENLGTIDSSTWIEYFETDIRSSFPGVTWWKISWDR
ncbi:MAG: hypothetical protein LBQ23_02755, partial [Puniceicoccales bacterium]|nr:hypothetical protein [Puniceicoccales bacterium]